MKIMAGLDGGGPSFFGELADAHNGNVHFGLGMRSVGSGFELQRQLALAQLDGGLAEATTAWGGLRDALRDSGAANLDRRRLHLSGQSTMRLVNGMPIESLSDAEQPTAEITAIPLTVRVTARPDRLSGFAPTEERAATWSLRRGRAQAALASAIFDNLGGVEIIISGPSQSKGVPLGNFNRRFTFDRPCPPWQLTDAQQFRQHYGWKGDESPDLSLLQGDVSSWLRDTSRNSILMVGATGFLANVTWARPN